MTTALCARAHARLLGLFEWLAQTAGHARFIVPGADRPSAGTSAATAPFPDPGPPDPFAPDGPPDPFDPDDPVPVPVVVDAGQTTAEYALVLLGVAAIALLVVAWAADSNKIGRLLDSVLDSILSDVT